MVANMCAMLMYNEAEKSSPCALFREFKRIPSSSADSLPWIYYAEGEASTVLSRKRIPAQYNLDPNSQVSIK